MTEPHQAIDEKSNKRYDKRKEQNLKIKKKQLEKTS